MLNWKTISDDDDYADARADLLILLEGVVYTPYLDTSGVPTIGIGFNLRANLKSVLKAMVGADHYSSTLYNQLKTQIDKSYSSASNATLQANLNKVMAAWHNNHDADVPTKFAFTSTAGVSTALELISSTYDAYIDKWIADIPDSDERLALYSLTYNNPSLLGSGLKAAITEGDRAEAWFQIRYYSNGGKSAGIANRRYVEADLFGLYDADGKATYAEALQTGRMLANHHEKILTYEATYDPDTAASTKGVDTITDITEQLQPAIRTALKHFGLSTKLHVEELLVTDTGVTTLSGDNTSADSAANNNDLLIGGKAAETLVGGAGGDILIGAAGRDVLTGGAGDDIFVFSAESDSTKAKPDLITDFNHAHDLIALTKALDADYDLLDRSEAFSGDGAEIRWYWKSGDTFVEIDQDGDGKLDLKIELDGKIKLTDADFSF